MISLLRLRDWALLLSCNFIWSCYFVLAKLVQQQMGPLTTTLFPVALATLLLIPIVRSKQRKKRAIGSSRHWPSGQVFQFMLLGVFGMVETQVFGAWGARLSLASNGSLLSLALPISTALMAYFLLGERMTRLRWLSFLLAIAGVLQCSGIDWKELNLTSKDYFPGNVLLFLSMFGSAFYNVYSKRLLELYSPLEVLLYSYYVAVTFLLPITLYLEPEGFRNIPSFAPGVWLGLILLALFHHFIAIIIFLKVLTRLDATQAALANYLMPFFGVIVAAVVLHERLTTSMVAGGLLVLASTLLITLYEERQRIQAKPSVVAEGG